MGAVCACGEQMSVGGCPLRGHRAKAFEMQREILEPPPHYDEIGRRFGVKMLWPVLLVQVRVLREAMAFCPTDERDQGMVFLLEHATVAGLDDDFGDPNLVERWRRLTCNPPSILESVETRSGLFLQWSKAQRRTGLAQLLASFDPMFEFWYERDPKAWHSGISPQAFEEIANLAVFPDPKW